jgi:hypothetical protein
MERLGLTHELLEVVRYYFVIKCPLNIAILLIWSTSRSLDRRARGLSRNGPEPRYLPGYDFSVQLTTAKLMSCI